MSFYLTLFVANVNKSVNQLYPSLTHQIAKNSSKNEQKHEI